MNEDRPWLGEEPSARADLSFPAGPTAFGVFFAVAAPIVFLGIALGVRRDGSPMTLVVLAGVLVGILAAALTYAALARRAGESGPPDPPSS